MGIKYRTGQGTSASDFTDLVVKVGDTLPIGTEVDYDGQSVPAGWQEVTSPYATKDVATTTTNGLMSASDKAKLDGISTATNYYSNITEILNGLSAQSNSVSQIVLNKAGQVTFNVTFDITATMSLNSNVVVFKIPTQVQPIRNVVLNGKLYHSTNQTSIFGNAYMRAGSREVVVNFNTSNIPVNSVITITGDYYVGM